MHGQVYKQRTGSVYNQCAASTTATVRSRQCAVVCEKIHRCTCLCTRRMRMPPRLLEGEGGKAQLDGAAVRASGHEPLAAQRDVREEVAVPPDRAALTCDVGHNYIGHNYMSHIELWPM